MKKFFIYLLLVLASAGNIKASEAITKKTISNIANQNSQLINQYPQLIQEIFRVDDVSELNAKTI